MSFIIQAPHPGIATTTYLPSPQLGDSVAPTGTLDFKRSMNGKKFVYIKSRASRKKLLWTFAISQYKVLELQSFFEAYNASNIKITDYDDTIYIGNFISNPFEFEAVRRSVASPGNETLHQIQLEFEGFIQ